MAYVENADVTGLIQTGYDSATTLTAAHVTDFVVKADGVIDARLARRYSVPFNAYGATPPTPVLVEQASRRLALSYCLNKIGLVMTVGGLLERAESEMEEALSLIKLLEDDASQLPPETATAEALTFGTGATSHSLQTDQAIIGASVITAGNVPNMLSDTVRAVTVASVSDDARLRNGVDFRVEYSEGWRAWVFRDLAGVFATSDTITYQWDYRRMDGYSRHVDGFSLA
jgi:hypothetical protein